MHNNHLSNWLRLFDFSDNTDRAFFSKRHLIIVSERTSCSYATVSILKNQEELNVSNKRKSGQKMIEKQIIKKNKWFI